ncbi:MAG TPA: carotenoid biosynthesis protein, partial [Candidatus Caenarcaniphilales bacterium]
MKQLITAERFCLVAHLVTMVFGLAGLLIVLPHLGSVLKLAATIQPSLAITIQHLFQWSMSGGGVANILLGAAAVAIHAYRILGLQNLLGFMIPAVSLSLGSELLGTSTGFPFGHYAYLNGL